MLTATKILPSHRVDTKGSADRALDAVARLKKSLGFLQASGNPRKAVFSNKQITEEMVAEARKNKKDPLRYLLILMTCAERCWSHGMALKQEANTEHRKKFLLLRKLEK